MLTLEAPRTCFELRFSKDNLNLYQHDVRQRDHTFCMAVSRSDSGIFVQVRCIIVSTQTCSMLSLKAALESCH